MNEQETKQTFQRRLVAVLAATAIGVAVTGCAPDDFEAPEGLDEPLPPPHPQEPMPPPQPQEPVVPDPNGNDNDEDDNSGD